MDRTPSVDLVWRRRSETLRCVVLVRGSATLYLQMYEQVSIRRRIGQEDEFAPKTYIVGSPERLV